MPNVTLGHKAPHLTKGDVFDDIGLSSSDITEAKIKADIWRELVTHIGGLNLRQKDLASHLDVHQPDVSNLLNGKLSKFSVGTLIQYAVKLNLGVRVEFTAPKSEKPKQRTVKSIQANGSPSHSKQKVARV